jgi:hypothetical protein
LVSLPPQVEAPLQGLQPVTGHRRYVLPSERSFDRPINSKIDRIVICAIDFGDDKKPIATEAVVRTLSVNGQGPDHLMIDVGLAHGARVGFDWGYTASG